MTSENPSYHLYGKRDFFLYIDLITLLYYYIS
nr:MAG TPA: hypothetical protein [Caudoviricetes sp.]